MKNTKNKIMMKKTLRVLIYLFMIIIVSIGIVPSIITGIMIITVNGLGDVLQKLTRDQENLERGKYDTF